jgi:hypothetical protein
MEEIKKILFEGTDAQRKYLFSFTVSTSSEDIYKKFQYFTRYFYPKFFKSKDAPFHKEMVMSLISMLRGESDEFLNIGFRGCSKTTFTKLFVAFVIANDTEQSRKYFKVLSEDIKNSKQVVTDVYNLLIQPRVVVYYPELFAKTDQKREETMDRFTTSTGIKVISGSIGQEQRGQIQEDSRPDFLWFDDIESRNTLRSAVKTRQIWDNMQEAIHGLARGGITTYTCNYISERGNVHLLVERVKNKLIVPIIDDNGIPTWDRYTLDEIESIKAKADDFEGEYLCKPSASKDVLFSREILEKQVSIQPIKILAGFKIFKEFNAGHRIAGGGDVALGVGLDSSTTTFIDFDTVPAQVIGTYYNNEIKPDDFGDEMARQGRIFGECLLAPEKNNAGHATIGRLKQIYPMSRIHATRKKENGIHVPVLNEFGWDTNSLTKSKMLNDLSSAIDDGLLNLNDEDLIREARSYTRNDLMDRDIDPRLATRHYDLLISCCIAWQMKDYAVKSSHTKKEYDPFQEIWDTNNIKGHDTSFE